MEYVSIDMPPIDSLTSNEVQKVILQLFPTFNVVGCKSGRMSCESRK